ncbi:MAG: phosphatase PAP2 family protein [Deltaproteobacteria bacterium]|nr:phosphatase PAP2 family protein [Deltaproteobacteria bacterium]
MSRSERIALWALLAAVLVVASLHWWVAADEWVFRWVQFHRGCGVEAASRWIDPIVRGTLALLIGIGLVWGGWRRPWRVLALLALFLIGAGAVEVLKTGIERLRPSSTPGMVTGNSFPSGHTTGAAMVAAIAVVLIRGRHWPRAAAIGACGVAAACVALQAIGRLLNGSHWLSDVVASALLGVAWVLGAGWMRRWSRVAVTSVVAIAGAAFLVFDDLPGVRLRLPSAIDESRASIASVEFGTLEGRAALGGRWSDGPREPIGPVSWALSSEVSATLRTEQEAAGVLKIMIRPATGAENRRRCSRLVISVNEWAAPEIALLRGWREYHVAPPPGVLRRGENTVRFRFAAEPGEAPPTASGGRVGFRYLRLYPRA